MWSQKLKFSKFTKIWYRGTLLYPYFEFNAYFSKIFVIHIFLGKFGPKIWRSSNSLKFDTEVHCEIVILNLMLIFPDFCHFHFWGQIWSQNLKFSKFTEIWYGGTFLYAYFDSNVYFFKNFVMYIILGKFGAKSNVLHIDWNFIQGRMKCNFSKYLPFINFWGKFHPKICCSAYLLKFSIEIPCNSVNMEKTKWNGISS